MPTLLLIDDDPAIHLAFRRAFPSSSLRLVCASDAEEGLALLPDDEPTVVVLDINLPQTSGLEVFRSIRRKNPDIPVLFISGGGSTDSVIEAMRLGAFDFLPKPLELPQVRDLVARALEASRASRTSAPAEPVSEPVSGDGLVGQSPAMREVYKAIGRVAPRNVTVLVQGESGTGKELVARALYLHSQRGTAPFLALNCAAIPDTLLESELFGHERGAFTGADRQRAGKFEQCSGGTLFLDEIGDMSPMTQAKVLRVLQEQRFERVGGNETIQSDARLIAATHRNLAALARSGRFREDLYYRLSVFTITLPPLRDRLDDLPLLVGHFVRRFRGELGKEVHRVAPETLDRLRLYSWPGNLRELQSVLKQALLVSHGPVLLPEFLPPLETPSTPVSRASAGPASPSSEPPMPDWASFVEHRLRAGSTALYAEAQSVMERDVLARVLRHTGGNQLQAARILGITRGTLRTRLRALGLAPGPGRWPDSDQK